jgi:hypothetical protein
MQLADISFIVQPEKNDNEEVLYTTEDIIKMDVQNVGPQGVY